MKRVKAWPSLELLRLMVLISAFEMGGTHFHSTHRSILLDLFLATPSPWVGLKQFPYRSDGKYKCSATMGKYSSATHQTFNWWHTTCRWALAGSKWNLLTTNRIKVRAINDGTINLYILTRFWNGFASDRREDSDERNGHFASFRHSKKVPKLAQGKIFHPFLGLFWWGFGPEKQLFGWVLGTK